MKLVFVTNNKHKLLEIRNLLSEGYELLSLEDIGCFEELPETKDTIWENAVEKASFIYTKFECPCFADDSGLEVEALNGRPGVNSAHYAGPARNSNDNIEKLLMEMRGKSNRKARFKTVIAFMNSPDPHLFEGVIEGEILNERTGTDGFGYDPIFRPIGSRLSFAEMKLSEKNKISHRSKAFNLLISYLRSNPGL